MRSVAITLSGIVAAPIDRVFDLLTDPHRAPDWLPGCQSVRVNGSPGRKGERWHLRVRTPLRTADLQIEILEYTPPTGFAWHERSEEHTSELQSRLHLVCRLLLEKKKKKKNTTMRRYLSTTQCNDM